MVVLSGDTSAETELAAALTGDGGRLCCTPDSLALGDEAETPGHFPSNLLFGPTGEYRAERPLSSVSIFVCMAGTFGASE